MGLTHTYQILSNSQAKKNTVLLTINYVNGHDPGTDSLEVPTIYKAYVLGLNFRGYTPQKMAKHMVLTVPYSTSILGSWRSPIDVNGRSPGS